MLIHEEIVKSFNAYLRPTDEFTYRRLQAKAVPFDVTIFTVPGSDFCDIQLSYDTEQSHNAECIGRALMMVGSVFVELGNAHASLSED